MGQSKVESFIEAVVNTTIGLLITLSVYPLINYMTGVKMTAAQVTLSTTLFTLVSIARGYVIRRFFNNFTNLKAWLMKTTRSYFQSPGTTATRERD